MKKIILSVGLLFLVSGVFAQDVSIDSEGNVITGSSNSTGNLKVFGGSGEDAIVGSTSSNYVSGVFGENTVSGNTGFVGGTEYGVRGDNGNGNSGWLGGDLEGAYGFCVTSGCIGVLGSSSDTGSGVQGFNRGSTNYGSLGTSNYGVYGESSSGYAGYFLGNTYVTGNLTVDGSLNATLSEIDPVFGAWDKSTGISITESQVTDLDKYSQIEVDTMIASLDSRITALENQPQTMHWDVPKIIETGTLNAFLPQIGVDSSGNAIVVWSQDNGTSLDIYANRYVAGTGWGTAEVIDYLPGDARYPRVSVDNSGNAMAVWEQGSDIYANRYVASAGWGTAEVINIDTGGSTGAKVGVDNSGNAIAVWSQGDGANYDLYANRYVAGTGWGTAEVIDIDTGIAYYSQVGVDSSGNAIVVWEQGDGMGDDIYANRYVAGTGWGTAEVIDNLPGDAHYPQIGVDSSGNAIVVWSQDNGTSSDIYANRYVAGAGWGTAEVIDNRPDHTRYPQVSVDNSGNAMAVWEQINITGYYAIQACRYNVTTGVWYTPEAIGFSYAGDSRYPQVGVDSSGNAIAVWRLWNGDFPHNSDIYTRRYEVEGGTGWGGNVAEVIGLGFHEADYSSPQIGVDSSGNAIVVWSQFYTTNERIFANRFW